VPAAKLSEARVLAAASAPAVRIRFDRNELAGSFGDIGTDLPLIIGMILAAGLDSASVFIVFGLAQILTGLVYGLPMPVQPLKAMAVLVIAQKAVGGAQITGDILYGAGLAIAVVMLGLSVTGALDWLARIIPRCLVRGIQFGLGLSLAWLALGKYVPSMGWTGYGLALAGFAVTVALWGNRRVPAALLVILIGIIYAAVFKLDWATISAGVGFTAPKLHLPVGADIWTGFLILTVPQIPLSLSNSVIATNQTIRDLFPARNISVRKIGLTYSLLNLVSPFLSGIPVCHGAGGLAGHYAFGARTGGSVIIYGTMYLVIGLFFSGIFGHVVQVFPQPILGVILMFEGLVLMLFIRDAASSRRDLALALLVALIAFAVPYGFAIGIVIGGALYALSEKFGVMTDRPAGK
jgi:xanthine/uracil/vitamin C permease (AzgA family)